MSTIEVVAASTVGRKGRNEDSFLVGGLVESSAGLSLRISTHSHLFREEGLLCAVADGMGGHAAGDVASRTVLRILAANVYGIARSVGSDLCSTLSAAALAGHARLLEVGHLDPAFASAGSTLTAVFVSGAGSAFVHAGDSRLYRVRGAEMLQLTTDHAMLGPGGRLLANCLGAGKEDGCVPETLGELSFEPGDIFMLCSDGLTSVLSAPRLRAVFDLPSPLRERARQLLEAARIAGAMDDVTVVLLERGGGTVDGPG